ncbi:MAG: hypothetical protein II821_10015 [Treponema sp.]|nr:hypothetical protein [Treponema sp.]
MEDEKKKRGGFREGSGRKKLSESGRVQVQFSLQQEEIELIKQLAEEAGLNKSRFIVECVNFWNINH